MAKKAKPVEADIIGAMDGKFAEWFPGSTWSAWKAILRGAFALPMSAEEAAFFHEVSGGRSPPTKRVSELWIIGGRRGGKDSIASLIAAHAAASFNGKRRTIAGITLPALRRGEKATVFTLAKDRDQARIALDYVRPYFLDTPELAQLITRETRDGLELANGCDIIIGTNDFKGIRGRAVLVAILDECAFYKDETSSSPDTELYAALTPGMLTLRDQAMLIGISTPHKKSGLLWTKYQEHYGKNDDDVLVVKATSMQLNPTLDAARIQKEIDADPELKRAEYLCEWRTDISSFVSPEVVAAAIMQGKQVLAPAGEAYVAFCDVSGGVNDAHSIAVSFPDNPDKVTKLSVLACARELKSADTEAVVSEFASILKSYGLSYVYADRYGAQWVVDSFKRHGIELRRSPYDRSALYLNLLPALNAGQIRLLDLSRIKSQLLALERRTIRGSGRDVVDHPQAGADDLINSIAGSLVLCAEGDRNVVHWYAASDDPGAWQRAVDHAKAADAAYRSLIAPGDENLSYQDRARRAAMGQNWRSQIPKSDPSYRPMGQQ